MSLLEIAQEMFSYADAATMSCKKDGLVNALYLEGGIRGVELGSVMFGSVDKDGAEIPAKLELVRLAIPRRVYTQSHFDYLISVIEEVWKNRFTVAGYRIAKQPPFLRHFTCHFEAVEKQVIPLSLRKTGS